MCQYTTCTSCSPCVAVNSKTDQNYQLAFTAKQRLYTGRVLGRKTTCN